MIKVNAIITNVEPKYTVKKIEKGTSHGIQNGSTNFDTVSVRFQYTLNFEFLSQSEYNQLEVLMHATGNTPNITVTFEIEERMFDGVTVDTVLGRILNKMKIVSPEEIPFTPYESDDTYRALQLVLQET